MRFFAIALALSLPLAAMAQDMEKINGDVTVEAGQHAGDVHSVNGGIDIGSNAVVQHAGTVNGEIHLGASAQAASLHTVNGSLTLDDGSRVTGEVRSANGEISLAPHADVTGNLSNANGTITLDHAHVGGNIATSNGDVTIGDSSHVDGGLTVNEVHSNGGNWGNHNPTIIIGPHAVVRGALDFHREVVLEVSDSAQIGPVQGATPKHFSGATP